MAFCGLYVVYMWEFLRLPLAGKSWGEKECHGPLLLWSDHAHFHDHTNVKPLVEYLELKKIPQSRLENMRERVRINCYLLAETICIRWLPHTMSSH